MMGCVQHLNLEVEWKEIEGKLGDGRLSLKSCTGFTLVY